MLGAVPRDASIREAPDPSDGSFLSKTAVALVTGARRKAMVEFVEVLAVADAITCSAQQMNQTYRRLVCCTEVPGKNRSA